jgi:hypothetical protein
MYEASGKADTVDDNDVRQVCNYVDALTYAVSRCAAKMDCLCQCGFLMRRTGD